MLDIISKNIFQDHCTTVACGFLHLPLLGVQMYHKTSVRHKYNQYNLKQPEIESLYI